jgi:1,4-alpha-glucan branching enzyme
MCGATWNGICCSINPTSARSTLWPHSTSFTAANRPFTQDFDQAGLSGLTVAITATASCPLFVGIRTASDFLVVVCNFTPQPHSHYRIGVPEKGYYKELFNSDAREFGGSNMGNLGGKWSDDWAYHGHPIPWI